MIKTKHLLAIFIPAILLVGLAFFVRVLQYDPLEPSAADYEKLKPKDFSIPLYTEDPIIGNKKAPITLVFFGDFACPACQAQHALLNELIAKYPQKIKIVWKGLPLNTYPESTELAHEYAYCANAQGKFIEFSEAAYTNGSNLNTSILNGIVEQIKLDQDKLNNCLNSSGPKTYSQKNQQLALVLNIQSLPTIFIDNKQIEIPTLLSGWETLLKL